MSFSNQHIDDFFRNGLQDFQQSPPNEVWSAIVHALKVQKRKKRTMIFLRSAASMAVLIAIGGGIFMGLRFLSPESGGYGSLTTIPSEYAEEFTDYTLTQYSDENIAFHYFEEEDATVYGEVPPAEDKKKDEGKPEERGSFDHEKIARKQAYLYSDYSRDDIELIRTERFSPETNFIPAEKREEDKKISSGTNTSERLTLGFHITSSYSYRSLRGGLSGTPPGHYFNGFETGVGSVSPGLTVSYMITPSVEIHVGAQISQMGQSINYSNKDKIISTRDQKSNTLTIQSSTGAITKINPTVFFIGNSSLTGKSSAESRNTFQKVSASNFHPISGNIEQKFTYFQIPVTARVYLLDNNSSRLFLSGGMTANLLLGNNVVLQRVNERIPIGKTDNITDLSFGARISGGIEQSISNGFYISLEPVFNYFVTPINPEHNLSTYPYSFGLSTMVRYRF